MRKIKEMLHHHDENTAANPTYGQTSSTSTVAESEIIGDKIDRRGTLEENLPKHSVIPTTTATSTAPLGTGLASATLPGSTTTKTTSSSMTPIGSTSASYSSSTSSTLPATQTATTVKSVPATVTPIATAVTPAIPISTTTPVATTTQVKTAPVQVERVAKPAVVQERIIPIQKEEIQPVIYREREQLDVKQVTEKLHETKIQPTVVEQRNLAPEVKPAVVMRGAPITPNVVTPSVQVEQTRSSAVVHQPIVQETVKKTVIEEVQPVLEREVIAPTVIKEVKPIYEKIVEAPRVFKEVLPTRELGVTGSTTQFVETGFVQQQPILGSGLAQPGLMQQQAPLSNQSSLTGKILNAEQNLKQFDQGLNSQSSSTLGSTQYPSTH